MQYKEEKNITKMRTWFKISVIIVLIVTLVLLVFIGNDRPVKDLTLVQLAILAFAVSFLAGITKDFLREEYGGTVLPKK